MTASMHHVTFSFQPNTGHFKIRAQYHNHKHAFTYMSQMHTHLARPITWYHAIEIHRRRRRSDEILTVQRLIFVKEHNCVFKSWNPTHKIWSFDSLLAGAQKLSREQGGGLRLSFPTTASSTSLINHTVSVDVKHHGIESAALKSSGAVQTGR